MVAGEGGDCLCVMGSQQEIQQGHKVPAKSEGRCASALEFMCARIALSSSERIR